MHVLEIDLTNPAIEVTTSYADDIVPNPNGNKNGNNGFNLRETLSQLAHARPLKVRMLSPVSIPGSSIPTTVLPEVRTSKTASSST